MEVELGSFRWSFGTRKCFQALLSCRTGKCRWKCEIIGRMLVAFRLGIDCFVVYVRLSRLRPYLGRGAAALPAAATILSRAAAAERERIGGCSYDNGPGSSEL